VSDSFWKKEISLGGGKKKEKQPPQDPQEPAVDAEPKQSFWKKEIGGKKKEKEPQAPKAEKQSFWKKEIGGKKKASAEDEQVARLVELATQSVDPSFAPVPVEDPLVQPTQVAEAVVAATPVEEHPVEVLPVDEPAAGGLSAAIVAASHDPAEPAYVVPVVEPVVPVVEPVAAVPVVEPVVPVVEPVAAVPVVEPVVPVVEPVAAVPVVEPVVPVVEPVAVVPSVEPVVPVVEPVAVVPSIEPVVPVVEPVAPVPSVEPVVPVEPDPLAEYHVEPAPVEEWMEPQPVEPWLAEAELPVDLDAYAQVVLHPPVPAAELPELPEQKVPFWKRDMSLGRKEKTTKAPSDGKVPFWKKELGGGKKAKAAAVVAVAAPAADDAPAPAAEEKAPFWKKELGGGKKAKAPKEPKQPKEPKAKRELSLPKLSLPALPSFGGGGGHSVKRLVGLKVGASQLAAARIANNGAAELLQVARADLEPGIVVAGELRDVDTLANALKEFFAKNKLPRTNVRLGIASNRIGVRTLDIAGIEDAKQLENAIHFRAQEALPIPLDEAVLDYHVLEERVDDEGTPTKRVLLVVAYRELVDRYVAACTKAGIRLAGIDLEAFALLRALSAPRAEGEPGDSALVAVSIGHERSTFAVSDGRVCEFTRVLEWGGSALNVAIARALDLAPSETEGIKRAVSLNSAEVPQGLTPEQYAVAVDAVRKQVHSFVRELVSSLQFYQSQPGSLGFGEIVITGGTANLGGLADELQRLLGMRVRVGDPLARLKITKKVPIEEAVSSYAVAIGLGIED
jgi:type IV pilus assembly protein PilM